MVMRKVGVLWSLWCQVQTAAATVSTRSALARPTRVTRHSSSRRNSTSTAIWRAAVAPSSPTSSVSPSDRSRSGSRTAAWSGSATTRWNSSRRGRPQPLNSTTSTKLLRRRMWRRRTTVWLQSYSDQPLPVPLCTIRISVTSTISSCSIIHGAFRQPLAADA